MIDPSSKTSYYLQTLYEENSLACGTCFFARRNSVMYLITNWHNATGKNPNTKEWLSTKHCMGPTHFRAYVFKNQDTIDWTELVIRLYDEDGKPLWLEHPVHKELVDVIAIPVEIPESSLVFPVEGAIEPFNEYTKASVKDDVFILGYPYGLKAGGLLPIWKRASIASEPVVDIDGLPKMYVDTASRSGMSGSPVIYKERRPMFISEGDPGTPTKFSKNFMQFVGIYSGRIGLEDEFQAQLGIVWKSEVINEIIGT